MSISNLVVFSQSQNMPYLLAQYNDLFKIDHFNSYTDWAVKKIVPGAFVIEGSDESYITSTIDVIRKDQEIFDTLCFVMGSTNSFDSYLLDGQLPPPPYLQEEINQVADLRESYKQVDNDISKAGRLIKYLWLRPKFILQPYHEWQCQRFYQYPLLDKLSNDATDSYEWLLTLVNTKILEPLVLIDRQRECIFCRSSHLSFIDACPNCRSINIEIQSSLHCFTCGCVDIQKKFLHDGILICPKCSTQLRHIGSDYDRPIENHGCQVCHQTFAEAEILVRCAMCEKEMVPNDLVSNKIYSWQLSDKGRTIAVRGTELDMISSFDQLNFISRDLFVHDLDWLLISSRRYPSITFSLFGLCFANLPELAETMGHSRLLQMLESFAQRLRNMLRTPDLSTRSSENLLWLLLPNTDEEGLRGFQARIEASLESMQVESEHKLEARFTGITSSQVPSREDAELLLARFRGELL